jgi:mannose-6-phosphate isomerase
MKKERKVFKLEGKVQHYAWGGAEYIPALLSVDNLECRPFAEYWLGAHENAPAVLVEAGISGSGRRARWGRILRIGLGDCPTC